MDPEALYTRIPAQSQLRLKDLVRIAGMGRKDVARALHVLVEHGRVYKFHNAPQILNRDHDMTCLCTMCTADDDLYEPYYIGTVYVRAEDVLAHPRYVRRHRVRKARTHAVPTEPSREPEAEDLDEPPCPLPILKDFLLDPEIQALLPKNDRQGAPAPHSSAVPPGSDGARAD